MEKESKVLFEFTKEEKEGLGFDNDHEIATLLGYAFGGAFIMDDVSGALDYLIDAMTRLGKLTDDEREILIKALDRATLSPEEYAKAYPSQD